MKTTLKSATIAAALILGAGTAIAGSDKQQQSTQQMNKQTEQKGTGGSGQMGQQNTSKDMKKVDGDVISVEESALYIRTPDGLAIPVAVTEEVTLLDGKPVKKGQGLSSSLHKGDRVSAQVSERNDAQGKPRNEASSINKK